MPQRVLTTPMLQRIVPKVTCLLEVPCTPSFLSLGIVTTRFKTGVFSGHGGGWWEMTSQGRGHKESLHYIWFSMVSLGGWWRLCKFPGG